MPPEPELPCTQGVVKVARMQRSAIRGLFVPSQPNINELKELVGATLVVAQCWSPKISVAAEVWATTRVGPYAFPQPNDIGSLPGLRCAASGLRMFHQ